MNVFTCPDCKTVGIVSITSDNNLIVSPCDCVAEEAK
jgi:hypothetical protein